jgi:hypothetical protein
MIDSNNTRSTFPIHHDIIFLNHTYHYLYDENNNANDDDDDEDISVLTFCTNSSSSSSSNMEHDEDENEDEVCGEQDYLANTDRPPQQQQQQGQSYRCSIFRVVVIIVTS